MEIFSDKSQDARSRLSEEALYAIAMREVENGLRRDGLWAKALCDSNMDERGAQARYIKLRVQSLRDEHEVNMQIEKQEIDRQQKIEKQRIADSLARDKAIAAAEANRPSQGFKKDLLNTLIGASAVAFVLGIIASISKLFPLKFP